MVKLLLRTKGQVGFDIGLVRTNEELETLVKRVKYSQILSKITFCFDKAR